MKTLWRKLKMLKENGMCLTLMENLSEDWLLKRLKILRGKHKPIFTPHVDTGDFVIVINADKVLLTGNKMKQKSLLLSFKISGRAKIGKL